MRTHELDYERGIADRLFRPALVPAKRRQRLGRDVLPPGPARVDLRRLRDTGHHALGGLWRNWVRPSVASWTRVIVAAAGTVNAGRLYLLVYGHSFSRWTSPIPSAYLAGMNEAAAQLGVPEVLWH